MDFELLEEILAAVRDFFYAILKIFGIEMNEEGNLEKA